MAEEQEDQARDGGGGAEEVADPAELLRIGTMTKALLDEAGEATLDEAGRRRLTEIHRRAVGLVKEAVSPTLRDELSEFALPLGDGDPTEPELRLAQAQLIGWLNGLLTGIQAAAIHQLQGGDGEAVAHEQTAPEGDGGRRQRSPYP